MPAAEVQLSVTASAQETEKKSGLLSTPLIIGIACGVCCILFLLCCFICIYLRKARRGAPKDEAVLNTDPSIGIRVEAIKRARLEAEAQKPQREAKSLAD